MTCRIDASEHLPAPAAAPGWQRLQLPAEVGICHTDRLRIDDGLALACSYYLPHRDLIETSRFDGDGGTLAITLGLQGQSRYHDRTGTELVFDAGHTTVTCFGAARGERRFMAHRPVRQLRLIVEPQALLRYGLTPLADAHASAGATRQLSFVPTALQTHAIAERIEVLAAAPRPSPIELHIAALQLLAEHARCGLPATASPPDRIDDDAPVREALALMHAHFDQPLTVDALALRVGINASRLKQGFRRLFDRSPHSVLVEIRMRAAWSFLERGVSVSSTGWRVGYTQPSNFSTAFTKFFGRTPKSVLGVKKR